MIDLFILLFFDISSYLFISFIFIRLIGVYYLRSD